MKRNIILISIIILGLISMIYIVTVNSFGYTAVPFEKEYHGIIYSNDHETFVEEVMILKGDFSNPEFGNSQFIGTLTFKNKSYDVSFKINTGEAIYIIDEYNTTGANTVLGYLHTDEEMSGLTVLIMSYNEEYQKSWNSDSGLIFTAPAENLEQAKQLTKALMMHSVLKFTE